MGLSRNARVRSSCVVSSSNSVTSRAASSRTKRGTRPLTLSLEREPTDMTDALDALRWNSTDPRRDDRSKDSEPELMLSRPELEDEDDDATDCRCACVSRPPDPRSPLLRFFFLPSDRWCDDADDLAVTIIMGCMAAAPACNDDALCSLPIDRPTGLLRRGRFEFSAFFAAVFRSILGSWTRFSFSVMGTPVRFDVFRWNYEECRNWVWNLTKAKWNSAQKCRKRYNMICFILLERVHIEDVYLHIAGMRTLIWIAAQDSTFTMNFVNAFQTTSPRLQRALPARHPDTASSPSLKSTEPTRGRGGTGCLGSVPPG